MCGGCARDLEQGLACSDVCAKRLAAPAEKAVRAFSAPPFEATAVRAAPVDVSRSMPRSARFTPPRFEDVKVRGG
jgi:hypothetical protein